MKVDDDEPSTSDTLEVDANSLGGLNPISALRSSAETFALCPAHTGEAISVAAPAPEPCSGMY